MLAGLSENDSRSASCVYVVPNEQVFVYIGKTVNGVWRRIRAHSGSHTHLGNPVRVHWPAATWHIEVYNFRTELGIAVVEHELFRRYHPQINWAYNTGRRRIEIAESQLRGPRMGPACRLVIDTGWPPCHDVALESRGESRPP